MHTHKSQKGFTLIEMLVVIGIIGLLASVVLLGLSNARVGGRDAKRIADLRSIQTGLEVYYSVCGFYPGGVAPGGGGACPDPVAGTFDAMKTALEDSVGLNISPIPSDPIPGGPTGGDYVYTASPNTAAQTYVLRAVLENKNHNALDNDLDGTPIGVDCSDGGNGYYCVQN